MRSFNKHGVVSPDVPIEKPPEKPRFQPSSDELAALVRETHFSEQEVTLLAQRFAGLDLDSSGTLTVDEFYNVPELALYPLLKRVLSIHNGDPTHS